MSNMRATYRLQLTPQFGFAEVKRLLPYFKELGITHLYLSPITEAPANSEHGYDVVNHNVIRKKLGGKEGFQDLCEGLSEYGLKVILDFVPNHSGARAINSYWQHVLAYGPRSSCALYFDINWHPLKPELRDKLLLAFLGAPYGETLDKGEIHIIYKKDRFFAAYYNHRFAITPESYHLILKKLPKDPSGKLDDLRQEIMRHGPYQEDEGERLLQKVAELDGKEQWNEALLQLQGEELHELLEKQFWRLAYWKTASQEINYRRFFDINELVAIRVESPFVFKRSHKLIKKLAQLEEVEGFRVDHVDGLHRPQVYLKRLKNLCGDKKIWVEKILSYDEKLPQKWPIEGTVGYEFLNELMYILIYRKNEKRIQTIYSHYMTSAVPFTEISFLSKYLVIRTMLSSELERLAHQLNMISETDYHTRDFTLSNLRQGIMGMIAALDQYRTYLPYEKDKAERALTLAANRFQAYVPSFERSVLDFILKTMLKKMEGSQEEVRIRWVERFQQYSATTMAKGVEDTAFYRYVPLVALNEVGGSPENFGMNLEDFYSRCRFRAEHYPYNLLATATHDTKRGEDLRMRLAVLSECPKLWHQALVRLGKIKVRAQLKILPSAKDRYLFYQMLAALWDPFDPTLRERLEEYMIKAVREAKENTSWLNPNELYEEGMRAFVKERLTNPKVSFALMPLVKEMEKSGFNNSLTQVLIKLTAPGVPDFYQGSELLELSMVDPDNRRPVHFILRQNLLSDMRPLIEHPDEQEISSWYNAQDEKLKMFFIARMLRFRQNHSQLFEGEFVPLDVVGEAAEHAVAYIRRKDHEILVVVALRFSSSFKGWGDTEIILPEARSWVDCLTGANLQAGDRLPLDRLSLPWAAFYGQ